MDLEKLRKLAAEGWPAQQIAKKLGVSRQRIYQLAEEHNIRFNRQSWNRGPVSQPTARIITGGISVPLSCTVAGTIAEALVSADLMARGLHVFASLFRLSHGHDLIACRQTGEILTFEVRCAHRNNEGKLVFPRKSECKSDYYALVVTGEPVIYKKVVGGECDPDLQNGISTNP